MNLSTIQKRLFAWGMAKANHADARAIRLQNCCNHDNLAMLKQDLLGSLQGRVLEIGAGAGANFSYYDRNITWIGVEPNLFMHAYLRDEAQRQGFEHIELHQGTAEALPLGDRSIDVVVSTHVLCSVSDPQQSMQEILRVLKPGGKFVFLEHIAATSGTPTRWLQDRIEPIWKTLFDRCHPNRETWKALETAGFEEVKEVRFSLSFPVVSPHMAGVAMKSA
jgi:ubiquinone/menaquinone biosynthesis C-methylase UbiE